MMLIGRFQLENLVSQRIQFVFLDLTKRRPKQGVWSHLLKGATRLSPANWQTDLAGVSLAAQAPIVLICDDGRLSGEVASYLESRGYAQVFVVDGGISGDAS